MKKTSNLPIIESSNLNLDSLILNGLSSLLFEENRRMPQDSYEVACTDFTRLPVEQNKRKEQFGNEKADKRIYWPQTNF